MTEPNYDPLAGIDGTIMGSENNYNISPVAKPAPAMLGGQVPDWLEKYMKSQPRGDPYNNGGRGLQQGLDILMSNKYLQDQNRIQYIRSLKSQH